MEGIIDKFGFLQIQRKGRKKQYCPYTKEDPCGDWCPQFEEYFDAGNKEVTCVNLLCCGASYKILEDQREETSNG